MENVTIENTEWKKTYNWPFWYSWEYFTPFTENVVYIYPLELARQILLKNSTACKEKPYAFSLPSNKLQWSAWNVLGRFINTVPLSRTRFQFPVIFSKAFCVLWFWQKPANRDKNLDLKKRFIWLITLLSDILDAWERIFT